MTKAINPSDSTLLIDWPITNSKSKYIQWNSDSSLLGFELIVWNQNTTIAELSKQGSQYETQVSFSLEKWKAIHAQFEKRTLEFAKHLDAGKTIVILPSKRRPFNYTNGSKTMTFQLHDCLSCDYDMVPTSGSGGTFYSIPESLQQHLSSNSNFKGTITVPKNFTSLGNINGHKDEILGAYGKVGNGWVIICPEFHHRSFSEFLNELDIFVPSLIARPEASELPAWTQDLIFKKEAPLIEQIKKTDAEIEKLLKSKESLSIKRKDFDKYKILISSKGDVLQRGIADLFRELGFEVSDHDNRKEDLVIRYKDKIATIEVKGKKGSSGSKDRRQISHWISEYSLKHDIDPKGILIVNGFNETPIKDRSEPVFTNEMLPDAERFKICLLTSAQLLAEYLDIKYGKTTTEDFVDRLFASEGLFSTQNNIIDHLD